jgi:hypothetical protein
MPALARGQESSCSYPELDLFTKVNGVLTDMYSVEFIIYEDVTTPGTPIQVYPATGRETLVVDTLCPVGDKLSTGRYVATYTPELTEPIGTHIICWYFKLTDTSPEQSFSEEFEVLAEAVGSSASGYCTVSQLRDAGVPSSGVGAKTDAELQEIIAAVSEEIDSYTGRFFEPRSMTINIDGTGRRGILIGDPIIDVTSITVLGDDTTSSQEIDLDDVRIYNRHITQNLRNPDDRESPKIEFLETDLRYDSPTYIGGDSAHYLFHPHRWPEGTQNVEIVGIFGYTDYDGSAYGKTPTAISKAAMLMALRELSPAYSSADEREDTLNRWRVTEYKTRDQTIKYADPTRAGLGAMGGIGPYTGDPVIDNILVRYTRPPNFGSV